MIPEKQSIQLPDVLIYKWIFNWEVDMDKVYSEKACASCGELFRPTGPRSATCSQDCRSAVKRCSCGNEVKTKSNKCNECAPRLMVKFRADKLAETGSTSIAYNYAYRSRNPAKYLLHNSVSRAKKKGFKHTIGEEDIIIPALCPVLGVPLVLEVGGGRNDNSPSLDRIDSSKGYIKGNVQAMSWRANNLKSNGTLEEFKKLVEFMDNE
jgi:hypothetical protein